MVYGDMVCRVHAGLGQNVTLFLYLEIFEPRRPVFKCCTLVIYYGHTIMSRRRSVGAYLDVRTSGPFLTSLRSGTR